MLVFSAFVPHSPLLLETVGQTKTDYFKKTLQSFKKLEHELYASRPDVVIIIGGHGDIKMDNLSISFAPKFSSSFKEIGDFATTRDFKPDAALIQQIKEYSINNIPLVLTTESALDYGMSIPLHLLMQEMPQTPIVPIHHSLLDDKSHYEFGKELREIIEHSSRRIAVIATGNLSHCLTDDAPAKYDEAGKAFDEMVKQAIKKNSAKKLLAEGGGLSLKVNDCSLKPLLILLGLLSDHSYKAEILSYEYPFGIGVLTAHFVVR